MYNQNATRIEGSSVSCGINRLILGDDPSKDKIAELVGQYKNHCAILVTSVPNRRKDIMMMLKENNFEPVKKPLEIIPDKSVITEFAEIAFLLQHHDNEFDEAGLEKYVKDTVSEKLTDMAASILHHGDYVENVKLFIRYMGK